MKNIIIVLTVFLLCIPVIVFADAGGLPALKTEVEAIQTNLQSQINNIQLKPGPPGPTGAMGPVGPAGPAGTNSRLTSFDDLDGLPCNVGSPYEGMIEVSYDTQTLLATTRCVWIARTLVLNLDLVSGSPYSCNPYSCNPHPCGLFNTCWETCYQTCYGDEPVRVDSNPLGIISCQRNADRSVTGTCTAVFPEGLQVTLYGIDPQNNNPAIFSGDCIGTSPCTFTMPHGTATVLATPVH